VPDGGTEAPEACQGHLGGGGTSSRVGFWRGLPPHHGSTCSMDLWAEAAPWRQDVVFLPGCTSTRSALILRVKAFELNAGILRGKAPVNPGLFGIALLFPRLGFVS